MAASRKTISMDQVKDTMHTMIRHCATKEEKSVICTALEKMLHDTGNYHGFKYNLTIAQWDILWNNGDTLRIDYAIEQGWITEYDRTYF